MAASTSQLGACALTCLTIKPTAANARKNTNMKTEPYTTFSNTPPHINDYGEAVLIIYDGNQHANALAAIEHEAYAVHVCYTRSEEVNLTSTLDSMDALGVTIAWEQVSND